ncbi:hypothetical protein D3C86_1139490 [compost metagenome]
MGDGDKIAQYRITTFVTETIVDLLEKIDVERAEAKGRLKPLGDLLHLQSELGEDETAVCCSRQFIRLRGAYRQIPVLPQGSITLAQFSDVACDAQHPTILLHRLGHPEPAAVIQVHLKGAIGQLAAPGLRREQPSLEIIVADDDTGAQPMVQPHDIRPGWQITGGKLKAFPKRRIGMAQPVLGIVKGNKDGGGTLKSCDTL